MAETNRAPFDLPEAKAESELVAGASSHARHHARPFLGALLTLILGIALGFFFGQCSELCGVLHGFMPIIISDSTSLPDIGTRSTSFGSLSSLKRATRLTRFC